MSVTQWRCVSTVEDAVTAVRTTLEDFSRSWRAGQMSRSRGTVLMSELRRQMAELQRACEEIYDVATEKKS